MHELSIAQALVEAVAEAMATHPAVVAGGTVTAVAVRVGAMSGVVPDALQFCFDVATRGTPLDGAALRVERVPVALWCAECARTVELPEAPPFRCPVCATPSADVRRGRELEVAWFEVDDGRPDAAAPSASSVTAARPGDAA